MSKPILTTESGAPVVDNQRSQTAGPQGPKLLQDQHLLEAAGYRINPFDLTKVWPHADYPLIEVGRLTLNRNPDNYFGDVEQAGFDPGNFVPGVGPSPDKMLQGRLFAYGDVPPSRRYRETDNFTQAGDLYRLQPADAKQRLVDNIAGGLSEISAGPVGEGIIERSMAHFRAADPEFGERVGQGIKERRG
jgi:catalase